MNQRRLLLFSLLLVAAWLALFGDKTPDETPAVVQPAPARLPGDGVSPRAPAAAPVATASLPSARAALEVAALIPRPQLIPVGGEEEARRDLFPSLSWTPPPPKPEKAARPPPPMAPPLPFVYLGKKLEDGQWEVYLGRGEQVYIAREGMTLDGGYQVTAVRPPTLSLLYLPLKQSQTIPIGGSP